MPYADTDFFLALFKTTDWLKENARTLLAEHAGDIWTSLATLIELILLSNRYGLKPEQLLDEVPRVASIRKGDLVLTREAVDHMAKNGLTTFDAFHAAAAGQDPIISSDKAFDRAGLDRIPLEKAA